MDTNPSLILFTEKLGKDGRPLFDSQADLARALKSVKGGGFEGKKDESIRGYLNQVLKPGKNPNSRMASPRLRNAIHEAIKARVTNSVKAEEIFARLTIAFSEHQSSGLSPKKDSEQFIEFEKYASLATTHLILTPEPAELNKTSKTAYGLTFEMAKSLGLLPPKNEIDQEKVVKYIFYVPDVGTASTLWLRLFNFLIDQKIPKTSAISLLEKVDEEGRLSVFTASQFLCAVPTVIFDPDNKETRRGFTLFHHENDEISLANFDKTSLDFWIRSIYCLLTSQPKEFNVSKIRWDDVKQKAFLD